MAAVKRVAVIGAGPAGAIAIDALAQEKAFETIRVFERREAPGGCWLADQDAPPHLSNFASLASRNADPPLELPTQFPARTPRSPQPRFFESSVYPYLETNIESLPMSFTQEAIPDERSELSIAKHGANTPFRHWKVIQKYIESLVTRRGYEKFVSYNTTVERAEKIGKEWKLILRRPETDAETDYWWVEWFDAVIVASGHYNVPYIPAIEGLEDFEQRYPGSIQHSKHFRGREPYKNKRVVVVGASVSAADIAVDLTDIAKGPVYAVIKGHKANGYFGDEAFKHPSIEAKPSISKISSDNGQRIVHFIDGTSVPDVDAIILGTGYSWSLPFLPQVQVRNNRVPGLYLHVLFRQDPSLLFVGAVSAGLTFKIFEYQAVLAARILANRAQLLPSLREQEQWEQDRIAKRGDGVPFTLVFPDFEEYFETVRKLAGEPRDGEPGRRLPVFEKRWFEAFMKGHEMRKRWWRGRNERARAEQRDVRARL